MTTTPLGVVFSAQTEHVDYVRTRAAEWLDRRFSELASDDYTVADAMGIDEHWPGTGDDDRLAAVSELIEEALDEDVILLVSPMVDDAELIETRSRDGVLTGARMFVETTSGVTLASRNQLWASDFVGEHTGRDAAFATLGQAALLIDALMTCYRAANGN